MPAPSTEPSPATPLSRSMDDAGLLGNASSAYLLDVLPSAGSQPLFSIFHLDTGALFREFSLFSMPVRGVVWCNEDSFVAYGAKECVLRSLFFFAPEDCCVLLVALSTFPCLCAKQEKIDAGRNPRLTSTRLCT